jgi:hypothetical protein
LRSAVDAWGAISTAAKDKPSAVLAHLIAAIREAQLAAHGSIPVALSLLGAAHLLAADATHAPTVLSEAEARCIGHAAVTVKLAAESRGDGVASPLEALVERRFVVARARIRGSILVPRDVEYALGGNIDGLRPMALAPERLPALRRLIEDGVNAALVVEWNNSAAEFIKDVADFADRQRS